MFLRLLLALSLIYAISAQARETKIPLTIAAIDWCPQICPQSKESPGYLVEIIQQIFKNSPYEIKIETYPWSRAIRLVRHGSANALLSPAKEEAPDLFYHQIPLSYQTHCFFKRRGDLWTYQGPEELINRDIIIYRDHSYGEILKDYLAKKDMKKLILTYDDSYLDKAIKSLNTNRADAFLFTVNSVTHHLIKNNINSVERDKCIKKDMLWMPFSHEKKELHIKAITFLDGALKDFIKTEQYKAILKKYHISFPPLDG